MIDEYLPQPGQNWYGYEIIREIGRGGMGVVYKAKQTNPSREVALKVINTSNLSKQVKRFEREIEVSVQLDHPKIAKLYKFDRINEFIVLVMEYIDGKPLDTFLKKHKVSLIDKINIFMDILKGIEHAHQKNIIHRDIKPDNILVTDKREVKIIDFGIARQVGRKFDLTKTGDILGTPQYMAPEQITGKREYIDQQTDIYALGTVLYEMLVGERMISEGSVMNVFYSIQHEEIISPKQKNIDVATGLQNIWQKAVARNKKRRYQTIDDFVKDIELFLNGGKIKKQRNYKPVWMALICLSILLLFGFIYAVKSKMSIIDIIALEEQKILDAIDQEKYEKALDIYLANPEYRYNYLLNRGVVLCCNKLRQEAIDAFSRGDYEVTEKYLQKVIKIFPYDVESLSYLAQVRSNEILKISETKELLNLKKDKEKTKQLQDACEYLQKCIVIEPHSSEFFLKMGVVKLALQQYEIGVTYLRKSLEFDQTNTDALKFLYEIPCYTSGLQEECYTDCINIMSVVPDHLINIDLFQEVFTQIQEEYSSDYFQFLVSNESKNQQSLFLETLEALEEEEKNSNLKNKLLYFKYIDNFEQKIEKLYRKLSPKTSEYKFLRDIIVTAKEQKEEEYQKFCYYQIAYMYNKQSWQNVRKLGEVFRENLSNIIFCDDIARKNAFITFLAIKTYIESYGFVDLVVGLKQQNICIINKILLIATLRSHAIPVKTEIFSLWQQQNYKNTQFGANEEEFIACMIAKSLYNYVENYGKDTFYRELDNSNFPVFSLNEKILLDDFAKSENLKIKVCALMTIYLSLGTREEYKQKNQNIILQITSLLESSPSVEIQRYIYVLFWRKVSQIQITPKEVFGIYDMGTHQDDLLIKRATISASYNISKVTWRIKDQKIVEQVNKHILKYLKKMIEESSQKNKINRTRENSILSLWAISHLGVLDEMNYSKMKEYLTSIECDVFEKMFGLMTKVKRSFGDTISLEMGRAIIEFWQDLEKETDPHFKVFSIYLFAQMGLQQEITETMEENRQVLQAVLYSLYYNPSIYLGYGNNKKMVSDIPFINLIIPQKTLLQRRNLVKKYCLKSEDKNIRFSALASHIPLLVEETERDRIYSEMTANSNEEQKKMIALGFRRCVESEVTINNKVNINELAETRTGQLYFSYLKRYIELLELLRSKNPTHILLWEKWYSCATQLDAQESSYLLEQALLFYYGKNDHQKAKETLSRAIGLSNNHGIINSFLHYYKIVLFANTNDSSKSLEILIEQSFMESELAQLCMRGGQYKEALWLYQKMINAQPVANISNFYRLIECLLSLQKEQEAEPFIEIAWEVFRRKQKNSGSQEVLNREDFLLHIPEDYPLLYNFVRNE